MDLIQLLGVQHMQKRYAEKPALSLYKIVQMINTCQSSSGLKTWYALNGQGQYYILDILQKWGDFNFLY